LIRLPAGSDFSDRLRIIYRDLSAVIEENRPECMAVEDIFYAKNIKSALKLGQARGAAVLAGVNAGLTIFEYSALQIKQAVVGYGKAGKEQVGDMVRYLFGLKGPLDLNTSDAIAAAVCHLNTRASCVKWDLAERS
jgi:crossover junction endodeoxyribonuclease RuvC